MGTQPFTENSKCFSSSARIYGENKQVVMKYIAKMKCLNLTRNLRLNATDRLIEESVRNDVYYQSCLQELQNMQDMFYNNISVFDVLVRGDKVISAYARNNELLEAFEKVDIKKFPIYFESLKKRFGAAVERQRLKDAAIETVAHIFEFHNALYVIIEKIVSYLTFIDLKILQFL